MKIAQMISLSLASIHLALAFPTQAAAEEVVICPDLPKPTTPSAPAAAEAACTATYTNGPHSINITGEGSFCSQIVGGLNQIKAKSPIDYEMIIGADPMLRGVQMGSNQAFVGSRIVQISATSAGDASYCPTILVHEALHVYNSVKGRPYWGCEGEAHSMERQAIMAERMGGDGSWGRSLKGHWPPAGYPGQCTDAGPAQIAPYAEAGIDKVVGSGAGVKLDGFASYDANERLAGNAAPQTMTNITRPDAYVWTSLAFGMVTGPFPTVNLPAGTHVITLTVKDLSNKTHSDSVTITVNAGSSGGDDVMAPIISNVNKTNITQTSVTVTWITNEASDSQVDYGTSTSYGSSSPLNSTDVTSHSVALSGLTAGTLYHYRVKSRDAAGNLAISGDFTFTTLSAADVTPPAPPRGVRKRP